jgi:hypothetical protein
VRREDSYTGHAGQMLLLLIPSQLMQRQTERQAVGFVAQCAEEEDDLAFPAEAKTLVRFGIV